MLRDDSSASCSAAALYVTPLHGLNCCCYVCRNTPTVLYRIAFALYGVGPLLVYAIPDSSIPLLVAQAVIALGCLTGGTAAFGAASLLGTLQKDLVA